MLTKEDLELLSQMMDKKLDEKLKPIKEDIENIKEDTEITRVAVNSVIEWIDTYFREDYPFPVEKKII